MSSEVPSTSYSASRRSKSQPNCNSDVAPLVLIKRPLRRPKIPNNVNHQVQIEKTLLFKKSNLVPNGLVDEIGQDLAALSLENQKLQPQTSNSKQKQSRRKKSPRNKNKEAQANSPQTNESQKEKPKSQRNRSKQKKQEYDDYLPPDVISTLLGVQENADPKMVTGCIRINPKFHQHAYVTIADDQQDIMIIGIKNRNRALEGDIVAVNINPKEMWHQITENTFQKTGYIVGILEKVHPRKVVGFLKLDKDGVNLIPRDARLPLVKIKPNTVPIGYFDNPANSEQIIVSGFITDWTKVSYSEG